MPKKRVYELAKEFSLENKELIVHLERIGIMVKSPSSSLDDSDVEKIRRELLASEPRHIVEERIKSTVIRRRAVRTPTVEVPPVEEVVEGKEDHPAEGEVDKLQKASFTKPSSAKVGKVKGEKPPEPDVAETQAAFAKPKKKSPKDEAKTEKVEIKDKPAADVTAIEKPKQPPVISQHRITQQETKRGILSKIPLKPGEKIIISPIEKTVKKEFEKPKKKGKAPIEVFIEEEKEVPRRKALEKKIEKKLSCLLYTSPSPRDCS